MVVVRIEQKGSGPRQVELPAGPVRVGRGNDCEIVLDSQFVSRRHAELRLDGGRPEVCDLGSSNGTTLNGTPLEPGSWHAFQEGDVVGIDEFSLSLVAPESSALTMPRSRRPIDELFVDTEAMEVWIGDQRLRLRQARVLKLLAYLYENRGRVCSEEELGNHIWGVEDADAPAGVPLYDPSSLYQLIYLARRAIEPTPREARYLVNVPGLGYRLLQRPEGSR